MRCIPVFVKKGDKEVARGEINRADTAQHKKQVAQRDRRIRLPIPSSSHLTAHHRAAIGLRFDTRA